MGIESSDGKGGLLTAESLDQVKLPGTYRVGNEVVERTVYPMGLVIDFTDAVYDELGRLLYVRAGNSGDAWRRKCLEDGTWTPWAKELSKSDPIYDTKSEE